MSTTTKKTRQHLHWHPTNHNDVIRYTSMLSPAQLAYWLILRSHFYASGCFPMSDKTVSRALRIDMTDPDLVELLEGDFGFELTADGWTVPELAEQFAQAEELYRKRREGGQKGGTKRAQNAGEVIRKPVAAAVEEEEEEDSGDF